MSDPVVGILAGACFILQPAIVLLAFIANRHNEMPLWQATIFVLLFVVVVSGMVGIGIVGADHFHGEFSEGYLTFGGFLAVFSGVGLIAAFFD